MKPYEYRHIVSFEETNLVGNVYYTNYLLWQGRCRELFLRQYVPEILDLLKEGFTLATVRVSCEYMTELAAFDEVVIRMRFERLKQNRLTIHFDYVRYSVAGEELVAQGAQEIACMRRNGDRFIAEPIPEALRKALLEYQEK